MGRNWDVDSQKFAFTEQKIEKLARPKKRKKYYDAKVEGLGVKVEPSGVATYFWHRSVVDRRGSGKAIWKTLGDCASTSLETARGAAAGYNAKRDDWRAGRVSENPFAVERSASSDELTLAELQELYITKHLVATSRAAEEAERKDRWRLQKYASSWLARPLSRITREDVETLHASIRGAISRSKSSDTGVSTANRTIEQLRRMFHWAREANVFAGANPAANIIKKKKDKRFAERSRDTFVQPDEMTRLEAALETCDADIRDFVVLALQTAARRSNVCAMRFDAINWSRRSWLIPQTKSGEAQLVPLTDAALEVLRRRVHERREPENPWVFPSRSKSGHLMDPKRAFAKLRRTAKLDHICVHDLRRTTASYMAIGGESLIAIGKLLGHTPGSAATAVYGRLHDSALRDTQAAGDRAMRRLMENPPLPALPAKTTLRGDQRFRTRLECRP
jgi:integrase